MMVFWHCMYNFLTLGKTVRLRFLDDSDDDEPMKLKPAASEEFEEESK